MIVQEPRAAVEAETTARDERPPASIGREVGQSVYLMALMAVMLTVYVGIGLLAVRLFG
jgi:hypothetical protein